MSTHQITLGGFSVPITTHLTPVTPGEHFRGQTMTQPPVPADTPRADLVDLSDEELRTESDRLLTVIGHYRRNGTPEDRDRYQRIGDERAARNRVRQQAEKARRLAALPDGAVDQVRSILSAGGISAEHIEFCIEHWMSRNWRGEFGVPIDAAYLHAMVRRHKIKEGILPTPAQLKARRSAAAQTSRLARAASAGRLARKYWAIWPDVEERLERARRHGQEEQWRRDHPEQVALLELPEPDGDQI